MARGSAGFTLRSAAIMSRLRGIHAGVTDVSESNMQEAVELLQREIQDRAPVETGHLRNSYDTHVEDTGAGAKGRVWSDVPYAAHQEYGTVHQPGTPHVRPAIEARRGDIIDIIGRRTLSDAIHSA